MGDDVSKILMEGMCELLRTHGVDCLQVLAHWKQQGHKALVFTQTQQMLDIMDRAVQALGYRSAPDSSPLSDSLSLACSLFQDQPEWRHHSCTLTNGHVHDMSGNQRQDRRFYGKGTESSPQ